MCNRVSIPSSLTISSLRLPQAAGHINCLSFRPSSIETSTASLWNISNPQLVFVSHTFVTNKYSPNTTNLVVLNKNNKIFGWNNSDKKQNRTSHDCHVTPPDIEASQLKITKRYYWKNLFCTCIIKAIILSNGYMWDMRICAPENVNVQRDW